MVMRCFKLSITNCYDVCTNPARRSLSAKAALQDSRPLPAKSRADPTPAAAATELLPHLRLPRTAGIHEPCCEGTQGGLALCVSALGAHLGSPLARAPAVAPTALGLLPHRCSQAGGTEPSPSAGVLPLPPNQEHLWFQHI